MNTESNVTPLSNIINFKVAKKNLALQYQDNSLSRYLKSLSFSQLIDETSVVIEELNQAGSTKEMIKKSNLVLRELGDRIGNSHGLAESFSKMKEKLEQKLHEFNH
ncbi:MAG: hypothetical protein CME60_11110 [Halobacteriovoraceae bacterium]|nr:hypothetical protein [Halobacteriovoraceae bacterium]